MSQRFRRSRPLPKAYTEPQLTFLKSYLPEFERRSLGPVRGDAKKFALERAADFITRFGVPEDAPADEEYNARFREQLYNWFKNTVGRNRRKAEGKPRSARKAAERATAATELPRQQHPWSHDPNPGPSPTTRNYVPPESSSPTVTGTYSHPQNSPAMTSPSPTIAAHIPVQYSLPSTLANALRPSPSPPPFRPPPGPVTVASLRDAFSNNTDAALLASQIDAFVVSNPSPLPLKPVVFALFQAISDEWDNTMRSANPFLTRFLGVASYFTSTITHAGVPGPLAAARALQMQIRKSAKWVPTSSANPRPSLPNSSSPSSSSSARSSASSMSQELLRIALDRARRKDHIQWARIHAAAVEVGVFNFGYELHDGDPGDVARGFEYGTGRAFSELMVHDALWEEDEVEWVAGVLVLGALIRTAMGGDVRQRRSYEDLLVSYEERWKEMKDEARQGLVTVRIASVHQFAVMLIHLVQEALLKAKADLARLSP
ncbi:hypothetical protein B0H10DRAFT_590136 [Mycena sp. CBHHK59/15]|nr:hypothetical protein B0H10DRAFT_590136 [Mycena sp. CBHHK59/15]